MAACLIVVFSAFISVIITAGAAAVVASSVLKSSKYVLTNLQGDDQIDVKKSYIFIHSCVGVFKKKKGNETWGHGEEILSELLHSIERSTVVDTLGAVLIGMIGSDNDVESAKRMLSERFLHVAGLLADRIHVVVEELSIELSEFPTLNYMQQFAIKAPPQTKLVYLHTKGVRKNGISDYYNDWRQYMTYFAIERFSICYKALDQFQYCTCGASKQGLIYAGNFWWTKAGYLASRRPLVSEISWNMKNRYLAEEYLLRNQSSPDERICTRPNSHAVPANLHYCVHHAHHTMQVCQTPRQWYVNVSDELRPTPQCYFRRLQPANPKKNDRYSWCHHKGLPPIPG
jgi:hypothetical protein